MGEGRSSHGGGEVLTDAQDLNTSFPDTPDTLEVQSRVPILKLPLGDQLMVGRESVDQLGKTWCKTQEAQTCGTWLRCGRWMKSTGYSSFRSDVFHPAASPRGRKKCGLWEQERGVS